MSDANSQERSGPPPTSDAIDAACDRFERAWQASRAGGPGPRIEDYLAEVPEAEHALLLRELILIELYHRTQAGECVAAGDYLQRFPSLSQRWLERKVRQQQGAEGPPPAEMPTQQPPREAVPLVPETRPPGLEAAQGIVAQTAGPPTLPVVAQGW
jgi:hypothetical protein